MKKSHNITEDKKAGNRKKHFASQRASFGRRAARPMATTAPSEQGIAANLDLIVPVFAAENPLPKWNMLDRYLVSAESLQLASLICVTKIDLVCNQAGSSYEELQSVMDRYRRIGYPVLTISVITGEGMDSLKKILKDKFSVLVGKSGVGKTSLVNMLKPELALRTGSVSDATGKGRHTTSRSQVIPLPFGGSIIDTPGMREFGLWGIHASDLASLFPEMRPFIGECKYKLDCCHDEEPGCAIRDAVMAGLISPYRYKSYLRMREEMT